MSTNPENTHKSPGIGARDSQVERWQPLTGRDAVAFIVKHPFGDYVTFDTFESVRQERDRLRAALEPYVTNCTMCAGGGEIPMSIRNGKWTYKECYRCAAARAALNQSDAQ